MTAAGADFVLWREKSAAAPFTVCAFFTASYRAKAERLAASLEALNLPYAIFEVPAVHRSVSPHGVGDLRCSKPRFIAACLAALGRPVLYADCDLVFRANPLAVEQAVLNGADFAAFNWLASPTTDAWVPVAGQAPAQPPRFWHFAFTVAEQSFDQLSTSGAVQVWRTSPATDVLLREWEATLARYDGAPDDQALDFAFNRGGAFAAGINPVWLPADRPHRLLALCETGDRPSRLSNGIAGFFRGRPARRPGAPENEFARSHISARPDPGRAPRPVAACRSGRRAGRGWALAGAAVPG